MEAKTLSIVIPAYNEERFIGTLLERIQAVDLGRLGLGREIIVVDDDSADRTAAIAGDFPEVRVFSLERNSGKGAAVRKGIALARGDYLIIQDADPEYDPQDYIPMLKALLSGAAHAVYGSRYLKRPEQGRLWNLLAGKHPAQGWAAYLGGQSLSFAALLFTGHYLTDTATALKLFHAPMLKALDLYSSGFELDHEITAKWLARSHTICEVPISYAPRSRAQGKKIGLSDWFAAVATFRRYRRG